MLIIKFNNLRFQMEISIHNVKINILSFLLYDLNRINIHNFFLWNNLN